MCLSIPGDDSNYSLSRHGVGANDGSMCSCGLKGARDFLECGQPPQGKLFVGFEAWFGEDLCWSYLCICLSDMLEDWTTYSFNGFFFCTH